MESMRAVSKSGRTMAELLAYHRFSLESYEAMIEHGILTRDDKVELIAGEIVEMSPIGSHHSATVSLIAQTIGRVLGDRSNVRTQQAIALPPDSEPEPDVAVVRSRKDHYWEAHPRPADIMLVIEVADTSLTVDRFVKLPIYAAAGIPESWIVDLTNSVIEVYREPRQDAYSTKTVLRRGDRIAPITFPDVSIEVNSLFPNA